MRGSILFQKNS